MKCEYIIVQAGGKGTRMEYLTANKPKALVPVGNLPMLFHLFRKYPDRKFIIIGDYKIDVLRKYLQSFADVRNIVVSAVGRKGTCAGIKDALRIIPNDRNFMLIWSDLILPEEFQLPKEYEENCVCDSNYVGLSKDFRCRWRYEDGQFDEIPSEDTGVAGFFLFKNKDVLRDVPSEGEFVRWLKESGMQFDTVDLYRTKEYGLLGVYNRSERLEGGRCRPFNKITEKDGWLIKEGIDEQGRRLAVREKEWYREVSRFDFTAIPQIKSFEPFMMEKIDGKNIYAYDLTHEEKRAVLAKIIGCLKELHKLKECETDYYSLQNAYVDKTFERLAKIRNMVPFADERYITVNGRRCRNVFFNQSELREKFADYDVPVFKFLHGDCTFSNMMLRRGEEPVLIDPRGYFGYTELCGDEAYDWAKLYYSIVGNYDRFNLKHFRLDIGEREVHLSIESNGWEDMEEDFFELIGDSVSKENIKLIHAIIWLSLTTYAWEDYDSICGAFYNGLYYLEQVL